MNLHPTTKVTLTLATVGAIVVSIWGAAQSWADKADKSEVDVIRKEVSEMREKAREESTIQRNILQLLDRMDKRMERIEDKQDYMIQEQYKRWNGGSQPPASTPSPNPLNNRDDR